MRKCVVCKHSRRSEIDVALTAGTPHRELADRFGLALATLSRHRAHLATATTGESSAASLQRAYAMLGLVPSSFELLWEDLEDVRWRSHPHDYPEAALIARAMIVNLRPAVREHERIRADEGEGNAAAHDVAAALADVVDVLRAEFNEAPVGRPRAAVAGALASAEALLRRVGGPPAYAGATRAQLEALAEHARQLRADFIAEQQS